MYEFYFGSVLLPVAPDKMTFKIKNQNKTMNLINEGEVNILKYAGLSEISFDLMIPSVKYPFARYADGFKPASYYLDIIETLKSQNAPFQFIVNRILPNGSSLSKTNMKVSLEDYTLKESSAEGLDFIVSVKLKQFRSYGTKTFEITSTDGDETTVTTDGTRSDESSPAPATVTSYKVVAGDTLWGIAKKYYGDGNKWSAIYEANKDAIGGNPNNISVGTVLTIPDAKTAKTATGSGTGKSTGTGSGTGTAKSYEQKNLYIVVRGDLTDADYIEVKFADYYNNCGRTDGKVVTKKFTTSSGDGSFIIKVRSDQTAELTVKSADNVNVGSRSSAFVKKNETTWTVSFAKGDATIYFYYNYQSSVEFGGSKLKGMTILVEGEKKYRNNLTFGRYVDGSGYLQSTLDAVNGNKFFYNCVEGTNANIHITSDPDQDFDIVLGGGQWTTVSASHIRAMMSENAKVTIKFKKGNGS